MKASAEDIACAQEEFVGTRVWVRYGKSSEGLYCRSGHIETIDIAKGGCWVRHDDGSLFGWAWGEIDVL